MPRADQEIDWSPEADEDLVDIWVYLARETSPEFADRQLQSIQQASAVCAIGRYRDETEAKSRWAYGPSSSGRT